MSLTVSRVLFQATMAYAAASMLAPNGRCKTLDSSADGYVRAESVVSMAVVAMSAGGPTALPIQAEAVIKVNLSRCHTMPCHLAIYAQSTYQFPMFDNSCDTDRGQV